MDGNNLESTLVRVMVWYHQATNITWANVDPDQCCHTASLGYIEWTALHILRPEQDDCLFTDNIFKLIFFNDSCYILMQISLKFALYDLFDDKPALVQIMAWHCTVDTPLSWPMIAYFGATYWNFCYQWLHVQHLIHKDDVVQMFNTLWPKHDATDVQPSLFEIWILFHHIDII